MTQASFNIGSVTDRMPISGGLPTPSKKVVVSQSAGADPSMVTEDDNLRNSGAQLGEIDVHSPSPWANPEMAAKPQSKPSAVNNVVPAAVVGDVGAALSPVPVTFHLREGDLRVTYELVIRTAKIIVLGYRTKQQVGGTIFIPATTNKLTMSVGGGRYNVMSLQAEFQLGELTLVVFPIWPEEKEDSDD